MGLNIQLDDEAMGTIGRGLYRILGIPDPNAQDGGPPPIDPSLAGDSSDYGDMTDKSHAPTKLGRLTQILAASRGDIPKPVITDEHTSPPAQPRSLQNIISGGQPPPVPQNFEGMNLPDYQPPSPVPAAGPIASRDMSALPNVGEVGTGARPNVRGTFQDQHPTLYRILKGLGTEAEGAAAGTGAMDFGEGFQRAHAVTDPRRRQMQDAQIADVQSQVAQRRAQTQAILNPPGKPNVSQPEFDKAGNIIGFRDQRGNLIGPKSPNLTQDMRDMIDAAEQRVTAPTTPEGQVMAYLVKSGKTPAQAYGIMKGMQQDAKPDTSTQVKQDFQNIIGKVTAEAGNKLDPGMLTDPRKTAAAISQSQTLSPAEKQRALSYIAANPTPANTIFAGSERGGAYGATRQYSVLDTKNGNRPVYVSADELNRASAQEPGRYLASGAGEKALNKENLMEDIRGGIQQVRAALENPSMPDFNVKQKVKIAVAMRERDPRSAVSSLITSGDLGYMTPEQEDYLIAHSILAEQAMAMRTVLGAGQGSQDLRAAITNTFPGPTTPSKRYGLKQLDAFEKTIDRLERGIPNVPLKPMANGQGGGNTTPAPQGMIAVQIPGQPVGHIPASARKQFLAENPGAQVIE
jgi:hypothetical protein